MPSEPSQPLTELLAAAGRGERSAHERVWSVVYDELRGIARHQMAGEAPGHTLQPTALVHEAYLRLMGGRDVDWANRRHFFAAAAKIMRQIRIDDARRRRRLKRGGPGVPTPRADTTGSRTVGVEDAGSGDAPAYGHGGVAGAGPGGDAVSARSGADPSGRGGSAAGGWLPGPPSARAAAHDGRGLGSADDGPAVFDQDPIEVLAIDEALTKLEHVDDRKAEIVTLRYFAGLTLAETAEAMGIGRAAVDRQWRVARAWLHRELGGG